jgi:hypothetical protein
MNSWIKLKTWFLDNRLEGSLALFFLVATLILASLAGIAWSGYATATAEYASKSSELAALSRKRPYPDAANLTVLKETLGRDMADLEKLEEDLQRFLIRPFADLDKGKAQDRPQLFQDALRQAVTKIKALAATTGSTLPQTFYLGLDDFENKPPLPDQTLSLAKQLTVLDWLAESLLNQGGVGIGEFSRPAELSGSKEPASQNRAKKPSPPDPKANTEATPYSTVGRVNLVFRCSQATLREFINAVASPAAPYFMIIESLQLQNTAREAPKRTAAEPSRPTSGKDRPQTRIPLLVGQENLNVSMRVRILEFTAPKTARSAVPPSK